MKGGEKIEPNDVSPLYRRLPTVSIIVGDNWVQVVLAHTDPTGRIIPICVITRELTTCSDVLPGLDDICCAIIECWQTLEMQVEFVPTTVLLGMPAWCLRSREMQIGTDIEFDERVSGIRLPRISERDTRRLEGLAAASEAPQYMVTAEILPQGYALGNSTVVENPVAYVSEHIELRYHVVYADLGTTLAFLNCLRRLGLRVERMVCPQSANGALLTDDERELGAAIVDVGRSRTVCSFYAKGVLRHSEVKIGGIDGIRRLMAFNLGRPSYDIGRDIREQRQILYRDAPNDPVLGAPLWRCMTSPAETKRFERAAFPAGKALMDEIARSINFARREMMLDLRYVVLSSDDPVTLHVLSQLARDQFGLRTRIAEPTHAPGSAEAELLHRSRTVAMFQHASRTAGRYCHFLDHYYRTPLNEFGHAISRRATEGSRHLLQRAAGKAAVSCGIAPPPAPTQQELKQLDQRAKNFANRKPRKRRVRWRRVPILASLCAVLF